MTDDTRDDAEEVATEAPRSPSLLDKLRAIVGRNPNFQYVLSPTELKVSDNAEDTTPADSSRTSGSAGTAYKLVGLGCTGLVGFAGLRWLLRRRKAGRG